MTMLKDQHEVVEVGDLLDDILHREDSLPLDKKLILKAYIQRPKPTDIVKEIFSNPEAEWQRPKPIKPLAAFRLTPTPKLEYRSLNSLFAFTQTKPQGGSWAYTKVVYGEGSTSEHALLGKLRRQYTPNTYYAFEIEKFLGEHF